jgi:hypothetical protein
MKVPPAGWKQKRVLEYNDKVYSEFGKNITKAKLKDEELDPKENLLSHLRPLDKNRESYKKVVDNGRVVTEYILPTLHDNQ